ncbi:3-deoxy-D-manno-octulosonic acid transferase [Oceaniglobus indicus]|uniref:3-deoxy-D-manno-octulosonic acid transferase n=1 Tax=Oceaniglobus indicus TaxID=2047749 RepID=UPI000C19806A|nr:glycosyltransferase N-terminal domain-containing protein [Oceaniglobus indicus]
MARQSAGMTAYLAFAAVSEPLWRLAMARRVRRGKEDGARVAEKFAHDMADRPPGPVLWFHALSVGESLALLPLLALAGRERPEAHILLTTSTRTSAVALGRVGLPPRVIHQFLPVDSAGPVRRFLDHWRPDRAVVTELDLWPGLLLAAHRRGIPLALINSRISPANFAKRSRGRGMFRDLLRLFDIVLVQDDDSAERFRALGVAADRVQVLGSLKAAAAPLPCDTRALQQLRDNLGQRSCWLAASFSRREVDTLCDGQLALRDTHLMVLAPRDLSDSESAERAAQARGLKTARRSRGEEIEPDTNVYLADTIGEMGLWYRLADVVFMGNSLNVPGPEHRGKNPFEAVVLDRPVLHGPSVGDFAETYEALDTAGAATTCADADAIAAEVRRLADPAVRAAMVQAGRAVVAERRAVLGRTWAALARQG